MNRRRLGGLIAKESRQIVRDPSSVAIAFVLPVLLLFLFGYGVSLDAENVRVALVIEDPTPEAEALAAGFEGSRYFDPVRVVHRTPAEAMMRRGDVRAVVVVRADFARAVTRGTAAVQVLTDGTDANTARLVAGYAEGVWRQWLAVRSAESGRPVARSVVAEQRIWFNPEVRSRNFLVPGLVAIVMTVTGALLTSLLIAREYDRGTIETLMATPVTVTELLLGKLVPTFVLGMASMALTVAMAVFLFDVPLRGSFAVLSGMAALFLLTALGMGMVISTAAKDQFVAGQVAIMVTFLPAFLLSGFIFNIDAMPAAVQALTHLVAARYFIAVVQTLFLVGTEWAVVLPNAAALAVMAVVFLGLARLLLKKRLD
ncbi:MAG: ABC transporter permease [Alphaproteobacteria bacterium]|jgi:ABC-2 type transport system permease protein|nr:ABC transporter permease [Alphaproteobacteria bacterium]